ncbi:MAG: hypothetical protein ACLU9S_04085 [Oscillospiraceae bacterium]
MPLCLCPAVSAVVGGAGHLPVCKEGFMAVAGAVMLRRKKKLGGAMWFGKVCNHGKLYLVTLVLDLLAQRSRDAGQQPHCNLRRYDAVYFAAGYVVVYIHMAKKSRTGSFDSVKA